MADILVTGGAGFIGSHLVQALAQRGDASRVRVLDNFATGFRKNLTGLADRIELVEADIRDMEEVRRAANGVEIVYHEAALPSVARSVSDPLESNSANITGTLNLLTAARDAGVRRVILASSSSVYGNAEEPEAQPAPSRVVSRAPAPTLPKSESIAPAPLSPYAVTKLAGELYARVFAQLYGMETICLRYFNVFGPRQDPTTQYAGAIAKFITCALRGEPYPVFGDGEQSRDFTYVENVVEANLLAATAIIQGYAIMNIACGERATLNQIITILNELTRQNLSAWYLPPRAGDIRHSLASIERAREIIGYSPSVGLREGLERTLKWYREEG
jgi:UDP-N-acetylglucosamine/UDP-N-acetyl-alpha-D-glucosaminouronate 4-epimerase